MITPLVIEKKIARLLHDLVPYIATGMSLFEINYSLVNELRFWLKYHRIFHTWSFFFSSFELEFRKNSFNLVGKLQLFRSVKLIETH